MIAWRRLYLLVIAGIFIVVAFAFWQEDELQPSGQIGSGPAILGSSNTNNN